MILAVLFFLGLPVVEEAPKMCELSVVQWRDAVLISRPVNPEKLDELKPVPVITFGCTFVEKDKVIVVMSFTRSLPDVLIVIPKDWVVSVTSLVPLVKEEKKK